MIKYFKIRALEDAEIDLESKIFFLTISNDSSLSVDFDIFEKGEDFEKSEDDPIISGYLKWDGCIQVSVNNMHICGPEDLPTLNRLIQAVFFCSKNFFEYCDYKQKEVKNIFEIENIP